MSGIKPGDRVSFTFVATLKDGTIFDSSSDPHGDDCGCGGDGPLEFTVGADEVFPALEQAVLGMQVGETRVVELRADEAFGPRDERGVVAVPRSEFPEDFALEEHMMLELEGEDEQVYPAWITRIESDFVTLDTNHPLAGEDLRYELTLDSISPTH